ncbi:hypothetical protein [Nostoc sp. CMAA1605]|nr:hypothetical protein [Nostoc sp. CMAA1605]
MGIGHGNTFANAPRDGAMMLCPAFGDRLRLVGSLNIVYLTGNEKQ